MSRDLKDLDESIRGICKGAIEAMKNDATLKKLGVTGIFISETKRSLAVQMAYYSRGRMKDLSDVRKMYIAAGLYNPSDAECRTPNTWTLASKHIEGLAIDLVPMIDGVIAWNAPLAVWERMGAIGKDYGLAWGGDWEQKDYPHFQKKI